MIRYALVCAKGHSFESWFQGSAAYDKQAKQKLVTCPLCGTAKVEKEIMSPRLGRSRLREEAPPPPNAAPGEQPNQATPVAMVSPQERELRKKLKELRDHLTQNSDYVGQKFPEVARKMHYGEIDHRSIYGEASPDEAKKLYEEGVEFHPLPVLPDERN
ncbi:MAG TPA: DUF1178 family protein [Xanthobacteraceae bacterium]|jgi:hypothetical protein|nr:DUF1178 family protein [Xanthobacteraceae bacterium]